MIENLFKFAATISFGTLKRLEEKLEEATKVRFQALSLARISGPLIGYHFENYFKNVAELDRAPRSNKESWHVLRTQLKQAGIDHRLKKFDIAEIRTHYRPITTQFHLENRLKLF